MQRANIRSLLLTTLMFFFMMSNGYAITINYQATDLADTIFGEDVWQYTYTVTDQVFSANDGFSIYFDLGLYSDLNDPPPSVNDDWDPISIQPDPAVPADGLYDALALVNNPSLANPFTISFVWLGQGTPGPQNFELYELIDDGLNIIGTGTTAPVPVPEPSTLLISGFCLYIASRYRKNISKKPSNPKL